MKNVAGTLFKDEEYILLDEHLVSLCTQHASWSSHLNMKGHKGYKDGLQPESLADGNWLVKQNQPVVRSNYGHCKV